MIQKMMLLAAVCCCLAPAAHAFSSVMPPNSNKLHHPTTPKTTRLYDTKEQNSNAFFVDEEINVKEAQVQTSENEELSDLDARVLKSMLQDDKLKLGEEENMRKLLERGVAPKSAPSVKTKKQQDDSDSDFSSTLFKVSRTVLYSIVDA